MDWRDFLAMLVVAIGAMLAIGMALWAGGWVR